MAVGPGLGEASRCFHPGGHLQEPTWLSDARTRTPHSLPEQACCCPWAVAALSTWFSARLTPFDSSASLCWSHIKGEPEESRHTHTTGNAHTSVLTVVRLEAVQRDRRAQCAALPHVPEETSPTSVRRGRLHRSGFLPCEPSPRGAINPPSPRKSSRTTRAMPPRPGAPLLTSKSRRVFLHQNIYVRTLSYSSKDKIHVHTNYNYAIIIQAQMLTGNLE